jgi:hypothetical protein
MSTNMTQPAQIPISNPSPSPQRNSAVQRCCDARERSLEASRAKELDSYTISSSAADAYRDAMPDLSGYENIRDFIACAAHGMVIRAIDSTDGPKLLYAAQVAIGALRHAPKTQKQLAT